MKPEQAIKELSYSMIALVTVLFGAAIVVQFLPDPPAPKPKEVSVVPEPTFTGAMADPAIRAMVTNRPASTNVNIYADSVTNETRVLSNKNDPFFESQWQSLTNYVYGPERDQHLSQILMQMHCTVKIDNLIIPQIEPFSAGLLPPTVTQPLYIHDAEPADQSAEAVRDWRVLVVSPVTGQVMRLLRKIDSGKLIVLDIDPPSKPAVALDFVTIGQLLTNRPPSNITNLIENLIKDGQFCQVHGHVWNPITNIAGLKHIQFAADKARKCGVCNLVQFKEEVWK